ncbi:MAG: hypothetical protein WD036_00585 [Bauldia sp.]
MARLIEIALVVAAVVFVWRVYRRRQTEAAALRHAARPMGIETPETLVKDPATGVYRPAGPKE